MKFNKLIPELSVSNIENSKKFYLALGFKIKYERVEDRFCFLELEENQIMIEEINNHWTSGEVLEYPFGRGINISMEVNNIETIKKRAIKNNYPIFIDVMENTYRVNEKEYIDREFLIKDVDGYLLRFNDSN